MKNRILIIFLFLAIWPPLLHGKELEHTLGSPHESQNVSDNSNMVRRELEAYNKMMSKPGSRPPKCEHSCGKCKPCKATQVPTNSDRLGLLYANYEPEGWKCKCGSAFFNP